MAKKKEAQDDAGKKQAVRRKKQEVKEAVQDVKPFEVFTLFKEGDNIDMIAKRLTGHSYMAFKVCEYSGVKYQDVRPGTILKWPVR